MTGPEHYREAERLIRVAEQSWDKSEAEHDAVLRNAQVHATLALAAATAEHITEQYTGGDDGNIARLWTEAIS